MSTDIQHRLSQFEAEPPAKVWDAITAKLDNETTGFSQRLYNYNAAPPADIWNRITSALDEVAKPAKIVRLYQKHSRTIRYGSMAAAIFVAVVLFNLFSKKAVSDDVAQLPTAQKVQKQESPAFDTPEKASITKMQANQKASVSSSNAGKEVAVNKKPSSNRYMTIANHDGKSVRLSKKVYPVIDCALKTEALTWSRCKENIQAMQAKMAASVGTSDFGGLIDMIKSLEEKQ